MDLKAAIRLTLEAGQYLAGLEAVRAQNLRTYGAMREGVKTAQASWKEAEATIKGMVSALDMGPPTKKQVRDFERAIKAAGALKDEYLRVRDAATAQKRALEQNAVQVAAARTGFDTAQAAQVQAAAVEAAQRREVQAVVAAKAAEAAEERRLAAIVANTRLSMAQAAQRQLQAEKQAYAEAQAAAERYAAQQRAQAAEAAARAKADAAYRAAVLSTQDSRDRFARQAAQQNVAKAPVQMPAPPNAQLSAISGQLALARNATLALVGAQTLADLVRMVDSYTQLAARLRLVTSSTQAATQAQQQLFNIAQRNGIALGDAAGLFLRIARPMREMGANQAQMLAVTEAVGQALRISGSNAQESSSAMQQFAQALGAGVLNGDELRSILENAPRLAQAVADGLGVPVGKLKELGEQGALSSQKVLDAIQSQIPKLRKEVEQIPLTIGAAITQVQNAFQQYIGQADAATGSSRKLAEMLSWMAKNIDTVVAAAAGIGTSFVLSAVIRSVAALAAAVGAIPAALTAVAGIAVTTWLSWGGSAEKAKKSTSESLSSMTRELKDFGGKLDETARNESIQKLVAKIEEARSRLKDMSFADAIGDPGKKLKADIAAAERAVADVKGIQAELDRKNLVDERGKLGLDKLKIDGSTLISKDAANQLQAFDRLYKAFSTNARNSNDDLATSFVEVRAAVDGLVSMAKSPAEMQGLVARLQTVVASPSGRFDPGLQNTLITAIEARSTAERNALDTTLAGLNTRLQRGNALVTSITEQARIASSLATAMDKVTAELKTDVPAISAAQSASIRAQVTAVEIGAQQQLEVLDRLSLEKLRIIQRERIAASRVATDARIDADKASASRLRDLQSTQARLESKPEANRSAAEKAQLEEVAAEQRRIAKATSDEKRRIIEAENRDAETFTRRMVDVERATAQERLTILKGLQTELLGKSNDALNAYKAYAAQVIALDKQIATNRLDTQSSINALLRQDMTPQQQLGNIREELDKVKAATADARASGDKQQQLEMLNRQKSLASSLAGVTGDGVDPKRNRAEAIDNLQRIGDESEVVLREQRAEAQAAAEAQKATFEQLAAAVQRISVEVGKLNAGEAIRLKGEIDMASVTSAIEQVRTAFNNETFQIKVAAAAPPLPVGTINAPQARAAGGPIFGPGGPTSDSIPALLSNGEHVLTAAEVRAAGGHSAIYALRSALLEGRIPRFAAGGAVSRVAVPELAAGAVAGAMQPMVIQMPDGSSFPVSGSPDVAKAMDRHVRLQVLKRGRVS